MKNEFIINQDLTIKDALISIEKNKHRSLIVVDDENRVVGALSDGDIRKALINDIVLTAVISKIMNTDFLYIKDVANINPNEFMEKKNIFLLPKIDKNHKLINIFVREY